LADQEKAKKKQPSPEVDHPILNTQKFTTSDFRGDTTTDGRKERQKKKRGMLEDQRAVRPGLGGKEKQIKKPGKKS